jgi:hypothetical protein
LRRGWRTSARTRTEERSALRDRAEAMLADLDGL